MPVLDDKFLARELIKAAVMRQIFCPYTGVILDMRRAVLLDGSDNGHGIIILDGKAWDLVKVDFLAVYSEEYDVYDGRELWRK